MLVTLPGEPCLYCRTVLLLCGCRDRGQFFEIDARFCLGLYQYMMMVRSNQWTAYSRVKGGIFPSRKGVPLSLEIQTLYFTLTGMFHLPGPHAPLSLTFVSPHPPSPTVLIGRDAGI